MLSPALSHTTGPESSNSNFLHLYHTLGYFHTYFSLTLATTLQDRPLLSSFTDVETEAQGS